MAEIDWDAVRARENQQNHWLDNQGGVLADISPQTLRENANEALADASNCSGRTDKEGRIGRC